MLKTTALALFALLSLHDVGWAQNVKIDIKVPGYTEADATVAIDLFRRNCRPLGAEFWVDVTSIEVTIKEEIAEHRLARGWKNTFHLALKYSDEPKAGPAYASGTGMLAGHTLHYDLGGGDTPGFLAIKQSSQYLCGLPFTTDGTPAFVRVPQFKFLDR